MDKMPINRKVDKMSKKVNGKGNSFKSSKITVEINLCVYLCEIDEIDKLEIFPHTFYTPKD